MIKNLAIFYHNLKQKGNDISYVSTIVFFVFSIGLHWFQAVMIFDIPRHFYSPIHIDNQGLNRWVNSVLFLGPLFIISFLLFKKSAFDAYGLTEMELRSGYRKHVIYIILSIILLIALLVNDGVRKGYF